MMTELFSLHNDFLAPLLNANPDKLIADELFFTAQCYLSRCGGAITPEGIQRVNEYVNRAAEKGHAEAQLWVATWTCPGGHSMFPNQESLKWLRKSAAQYNPTACYRLSTSYGTIDGLPDNTERAALCRVAAEAGMASAMGDLALRYENGRDVEKNEEIAKYWSTFSALIAMADVDKFNEKYPDFIRIIERAAEAGDRDALYRVGYHLMGENPSEGYAKLQKAADLGYPMAMMALAGYALTQPHGKDTQAALQYELQAFEKGSPDAAYLLACQHLFGEVGEKDAALAWKYLEKGLNQGDPSCQFLFSRIVDNDMLDGILEKPFLKNSEEGCDGIRYWIYLQRSAINGYAPAKELLTELED